MRVITRLVINLFLLFVILGCDEFSGEVPVPGYLEIESYNLEHEDALGITDVWVYVDGNFLGVYEIPAKFPVIAQGQTKVSILGGIKVNGISVTRTWYPFYKSVEQTLDIQPSEVIKLNPSSRYQDWANISFQEGFENGHLFEKSEYSDTVFVITDEEKYADSFSGAAYLDAKHYFFEAITPQFAIPQLSGTPGMYIELNYKCDIPFEIGVYVYYQQSLYTINLVAINSTTQWKKIYIDLYNTLIKYGEGAPYKIYIAAYNNTNQTKSSVYIDDFKVVQSGE